MGPRNYYYYFHFYSQQKKVFLSHIYILLRYCLLPLWPQKYYDQHKYWSNNYNHSSPTPQPVTLGGRFDGF